MKCLIVDDDRVKVRNIRECIETNIDSYVYIDVAQCVVDAKRLLTSDVFDLLILDVCLPYRADDKPKNDAGPSLLSEIYARDNLKKPKYIIGITAYPDLFENWNDDIGDHLWSIVKFDSKQSDWCNRLSSVISHIETANKQPKKIKYQYDLGIVVALREPELDEVLKLPWNWKQCNHDNDPAEYYEGHIKIKDRTLTVVATVTSRMGMVSSSIITTKLICKYKPRYISMVGICAGIGESIEPGDVIVADPVWNYQSGKKVATKKSFEIEPHQIQLRNFIRRRMSQLAKDTDILTRIKSDWQGEQSRSDIKLHIGPVASGSQVLADADFIDLIKEQNRKLLGVEMEIYGLYSAAEESIFPQPVFFALKGVSDFADDNKSDKHQHYAAYTSANILKHFVTKHLIDLISTSEHDQLSEN